MPTGCEKKGTGYCGSGRKHEAQKHWKELQRLTRLGTCIETRSNQGIGVIAEERLTHEACAIVSNFSEEMFQNDFHIHNYDKM